MSMKNRDGVCLPSRMTHAKLLEFQFSHLAVMNEQRLDTTPFRPFNNDQLTLITGTPTDKEQKAANSSK